MRWIWLAPAGAFAYGLFELGPLITDFDPLFSPLVVIAFGVFAALCAGAFLLIAFAIRRRRPGRALVAIAFTIGFQAATPVEVGWHDGCNEHSGEVPAIAVPHVKLAQPEAGFVAYLDTSTSMGC